VIQLLYLNVVIYRNRLEVVPDRHVLMHLLPSNVSWNHRTVVNYDIIWHDLTLTCIDHLIAISIDDLVKVFVGRYYSFLFLVIFELLRVIVLAFLVALVVLLILGLIWVIHVQKFRIVFVVVYGAFRTKRFKHHDFPSCLETYTPLKRIDPQILFDQHQSAKLRFVILKYKLLWFQVIG